MENEEWYSVKKNLQTDSYEPPFIDEQISFWIKKTYSHRYSSDVVLFKYELFTSNLLPTTLKSGNFTCLKIYDGCQSIGCGVYSFIVFEISDENGVCRTLKWGRQGIEDIVRIFGFMRSLNCYQDWKDRDTVLDLYKSNGITDRDIDNLLSREISDLGITSYEE